MSLQWMREKYQEKMGETASSTQTEEKEPSEGEDTVIGDESPPWIIWTHQQHWANYV